MVRRWAFWEDQSKTKSGPNNGPQSAGPGRIKHVMTGRTCACFWMGNRGITLFHADVKAGCPCYGLLWRFAWSLCVGVWQVKWLFMTSSLHSVTFGSRQQLMSAFVPVFVCAGVKILYMKAVAAVFGRSQMSLRWGGLQRFNKRGLKPDAGRWMVRQKGKEK